MTEREALIALLSLFDDAVFLWGIDDEPRIKATLRDAREAVGQ